MPDIVTVTLNPAVDVSTHAPEVVPTIKVRCTSPMKQAGGGGLNVARVAGRFGASVTSLVIAGGKIGDLLLALLEAEGLSPIAVRVEGETRENVTVTEIQSGEQYRFVMPGPAVSEDAAVRVLSSLRALAPAPKIIVFSGSHPAGLPSSFARDLSEIALTHGAKLIVDGPPDVLAGTRGAFMVKPNERELALLVGGPLRDLEACGTAAERLIAAGTAENVLVSMGEDGALLVSPRETIAYRGPQFTVVSAVGAGDSMVGATAAGLIRGLSLPDAAAEGVAAGTAAILTPGTDLCWPKDMQTILPKIARTNLSGEMF